MITLNTNPGLLRTAVYERILSDLQQGIIVPGEAISLNKLAEDGFLTKEKNGRSYHLKLTQRGENAFVVCHQVFIDWDAQSLGGLTAQERQQLLTLLQKAVQKKVCK